MSEQQTAVEQNTITLIANVAGLNKSVSGIDRLINSMYKLGAIMNNLGKMMAANAALTNRAILPNFNPATIKAVIQGVISQNIKIAKSMAPSKSGGVIGGSQAFSASGAMQGILGGLGNDLKSAILTPLKDILGAGMKMPGQAGGGGGSVIGQVAAAPFKAMAGIGKAGFKAATGTMKAMGGAFTSMGPQMAALALVMEPIMALIGGILEPFSIFTDIFGLYGQIIGQAFLPIIMQLVPLFMSLVPLIVSFAKIVEALTPLMFMFIIPMVQIASVVGTLLTPLLDVAAAAIHNFLAPLRLLQSDFTNLVTWFSDAWATLMKPITDFVEWTTNGAETLGGFFGGIKDFFSNEGKYKDWWKV